MRNIEEVVREFAATNDNSPAYIRERATLEVLIGIKEALNEINQNLKDAAARSAFLSHDLFELEKE